MPELDHVIIGTAGHIDHGKTALVKALTGIDADTLAEEKRRGITIELGFVFMKTPGYDKQIVFIDVPGHEKLVKTMVAGASNIDASLLVIAADEGVNIQTREHFDILQLLGIKSGIIALTKSDLVDEKRIQELKAEVRDFVKGTFLADAPIIPVSSITGQGVDEIKSALMRVGQEVKKRYDNGIFRMPIDRVFTMPGFGTVIAGTTLSGEVSVGDKIEIYPEGITAKVRSIQVHNISKEKSSVGKRTALNLQDIKKELLRRGQCAGLAGSLNPTYRLDARLKLLESYAKELKQRSRVRLHVGTEEVICRLVLLDKQVLLPGEMGLVQFVLEKPTVALPKDHFVIRTFSPLMTIGGGTILDAAPAKHKRFDEQVIQGLKRFEGTLADIVEQTFINSNFIPKSPEELSLKIGERQKEVEEVIENLQKKGNLVKIDTEKYLYFSAYRNLVEKLLATVKSYLSTDSFRLYMPFSDLRSQFLKLTDQQTFKTAIDELLNKKIIFKKDSQLGLVGHEISLKPREQELLIRIEQAFQKARFAAPLEEDIQKRLGLRTDIFQKMVKRLIEQEKLVRLNKKVTYHHETLSAAKELVLNHIKKQQSITIAELRDKLHLSRKYAQAILEYFDRTGLTIRKEDRHVIK
jgi:selenocysteine-specific elongation factor